MRTRFDEQLALLNRNLIRMGAICEESIALAAKAIGSGGAELARQISPLSAELDELEREVENLCLQLLLRQQPVARDLRYVSTALKMVTDMQRIGNQAEDIAGIVLVMHRSSENELPLLGEMARAVIEMVTGSVDAFVRQNVTLARQVIDRDDEVDEDLIRVKDILIDMIASHPEQGQEALDLLMIAKYFERIGDHAVNVAGWVVFAVTGQHEGEHI